MRVLLTTDTVGGVWTFTRELTKHLLQQGNSVALVSFGRAPSENQSKWAEAVKLAHSDQFLVYACNAPLEWMQENDRAWEEGAELLINVARSFQADMLHSSQFCWGALPLALPKLITAHSDVRSWAAACRGHSLSSSPWLGRYDALVQNGINGADAVVSPTAWMRGTLRAHYEVAAPFLVIANGRTVPDFAMEIKRTLRAVTAGRFWDEGKGLEIVNEIVSPMPIHIAGELSFEGSVGAGIKPHVTASGTLDEDGLLELFNTSSVYLATSIYEPFGLAPLEAALCGCAIVARDLPSFREVWGDTAFYFRDAVGLQHVLTVLANHSGILAGKRIAAAERARTFTAERMTNEYVSLYRKMMADRSSPSSEVQQEMHAA